MFARVPLHAGRRWELWIAQEQTRQSPWQHRLVVMVMMLVATHATYSAPGLPACNVIIENAISLTDVTPLYMYMMCLSGGAWRHCNTVLLAWIIQE